MLAKGVPLSCRLLKPFIWYILEFKSLIYSSANTEAICHLGLYVKFWLLLCHRCGLLFVLRHSCIYLGRRLFYPLFEGFIRFNLGFVLLSFCSLFIACTQLAFPIILYIVFLGVLVNFNYPLILRRLHAKAFISRISYYLFLDWLLIVVHGLGPWFKAFR